MGIERNMDEPQPGATGGTGEGGGSRPPGSEVPPTPGGETPQGPEEALAALFAKAFNSPAFMGLFDAKIQQVLIERQRVAQQVAQESEQRPPWPNSEFGRLMDRIEALQGQTASPDRDRELQNTIEARDRLLDEENILGLLSSPKTELLGMYYDARVKTTLKEKEGKEEYRERGGKLDELIDRRDEADVRSWEEATMEYRRYGRPTRHRRGQFWSDQRITDLNKRMQERPEVAQLIARLGGVPNLEQLKARYAGSIDYFYRESMNMIVEVVEDPDAYRYPKGSYRENWVNRSNGMGLRRVWNGVDGVVVDERGRPSLIDEEGDIRRAANWDDVREAVEEERAMDAYVSSRDYETWIQFVADNGEEIKRHMTDIAKKVIRKLGSGDAQSLYEHLKQEEQKIETALAYFKFPKKERRRITSILVNEIIGLGAYEFSKKIREDVGPYFMFAKRLATACEDTELQDHFVDSTILDEKGENLAALSLYSGDLPSTPELAHLVSQKLRENLENGGFWRYGRNTRNTYQKIDGEHDMGAFYRRQRVYRKKFEEILTSIKLRPMKDLLNLNDDGVSQGNPNHPAFQRLKKRLDVLDRKDKDNNQGNILDADGNPTTATRWQEYCRKALAWENGQLDELRDSPRVIFQHPLARAFRPKGYKDKDGIETTVDEYWSMYKLEDRTEEWYKKAKRRRVREIVGREKRAERILTIFQMDAAAGLARHLLDKIKLDSEGKWWSPYGDVENKDLKPVSLEITPDLKFPITWNDQDKRYVVEDIVPHFVLMRALSQQALKEDQAKAEKYGEERRFFKAYHVLRNQAGIPIDSPQFASWSEGSDDTIRPVLMKYTGQISIFNTIFKKAEERMDKKMMLLDGRKDRDGTDEKNLITRWQENERRFRLALKYAVRKKWEKYYNFPGHNSKYGGTKEIRNANEPAYGISSDTVETTAFIQELLGPEEDFGTDFGCTESPWKQLVGLWKCSDEVAFAESGYLGYIAGPRDPESWVKRAQGNFALVDLYSKGDKNQPGSFGVLNSGLLSGVFHLRTLNVGGQANYGIQEENFGINKPSAAYNEMLEPSYEHYVDAAARVIAPMMSVMYQIYSSEDSNFGRNPGSAKFLATMYWYSLSSWMDREWAEYRGIYGFAYDGVLPLARTFMHTVLKESALIYTDTQWDEIMLGYSRVEYTDGAVERVVRYKVDDEDNTVERVYKETKTGKDGDIIKVGVTRRRDDELISSGKKIENVEVQEGILDALPKKLREEIIKINNNPDPTVRKWLPMGIDSYRPETLAIFNKFKQVEPSERTKKLYKVVEENLRAFTSPRKWVFRPK